MQVHIHAITHIIKEKLGYFHFFLPECWPGVSIQPEVPGVYYIDIVFVRSPLFFHIKQRTAVILYRRFGTKYRSLLQGSRSRRRLFDTWRWPIGCPETSVRNCHSTLRNTKEERGSNPRQGGNLKSHIVFCDFSVSSSKYRDGSQIPSCCCMFLLHPSKLHFIKMNFHHILSPNFAI